MTKLKMLAAGSFLLCLHQACFAQGADSLVLHPLQGVEVVLTGRGLEKLVNENNVELLKNHLVDDVQRAERNPDFPGYNQELIYLAAADGRRRMKVKPEDVSGFNLAEEVAKFKNDLPPVHYAIYDLKPAFEYHIYFSTRAQLDSLRAFNLAKAISEANASKTATLRRYTHTEVREEGGSYAFTALRNKKQDLIELTASLGFAVLNSSPSPVLGAELNLNFTNKYGATKYKLGLGLNQFVFANYASFKFTDLMALTAIDLRFTLPMSSRRDTWFGLTGGIVKARALSGSPANLDLNNKPKFGLMFEKRGYSIEYFMIKGTGKEWMRGLTFKFGL